MEHGGRKVWFVTGASSGLGRAVVEHLLEKGDNVVATLRKPQDISDLVQQYSTDRLLVVKLDVISPSDIQTAFEKAIEKFSRVDVVYNNAGFAILGEIEGTPDEAARSLFEVNFWGLTNVSREAVRVFRMSINLEVAGLFKLPVLLASKACPGLGIIAPEGITQALANELHPSWNITITLLEMGSFHTRAAQPQSLFVVPPHPAYTASDSTTKSVREHLPTNGLKINDATKAAREIRNIGLDPTAGLRVLLGLDAFDAISSQLSLIQKDLGGAVKWSTDLKLAD